MKLIKIIMVIFILLFINVFFVNDHSYSEIISATGTINAISPFLELDKKQVNYICFTFNEDKETPYFIKLKDAPLLGITNIKRASNPRETNELMNELQKILGVKVKINYNTIKGKNVVSSFQRL